MLSRSWNNNTVHMNTDSIIIPCLYDVLHNILLLLSCILYLMKVDTNLLIDLEMGRYFYLPIDYILYALKY